MRAPKSFEDGMARLETILSQMQSEETTLSESSSSMQKRLR